MPQEFKPGCTRPTGGVVGEKEKEKTIQTEQGDPDSGIKPGTSFEEIPDDWVCPVCGAPKSMFVEEGCVYKEQGVLL